MSIYITKLNKISNTASSLTASHYCEYQSMTQDSILPKQYKVNTNTSSNYHKLLLIAMSIKAGQEIHV